MSQPPIIKKTSTQEEAHRLFDQLEPITIEEMAGKWRGHEWKTGHPMDGLLEQANWYGKFFTKHGDAHPLVFKKKDGDLFNVNPHIIPGWLPLEKIPKRLVRPGIQLFHPLLSTKRPKARLRMMENRGKVSAAMVYDRIAIIDHFRKLDDRTLAGLMDYKGQPENMHYFFILEKE